MLRSAATPSHYSTACTFKRRDVNLSSRRNERRFRSAGHDLMHEEGVDAAGATDEQARRKIKETRE